MATETEKAAWLAEMRAMEAQPPTVDTDVSLRDYFAGQALVGLLSTARGQETHEGNVASYAYHYADAMLAERAKGG